jgi:hypothetical protein
MNFTTTADVNFFYVILNFKKIHIRSSGEVQNQNKIISDDNYTGVSFLASNDSGGKSGRSLFQVCQTRSASQLHGSTAYKTRRKTRILQTF